MKKILRKIFILILISLITINLSGIVKADNEASTENIIENELETENTAENDEQTDDSTTEENLETENMEETGGTENVTEEEDDDDEFTQKLASSISVYDGNYSEVTDKDLTINQIVNGDIYIISVGTITIPYTVTGNVFIIADTVEIEETAFIFGSIYVACSTLNMEGYTYGNIYAIANEMDVADTATIEMDLLAMTSNTKIYGNVNRNVSLYCDEILVDEGADIGGDFEYYSENECNIPEECVVGNITYSKVTEIQDEKTFEDYLYMFVSFIIFAIIVYLVCKFAKARVISESKNFGKNAPWIFLYSIIGLFFIPCLAIILLLLGVTFYVAILLIAIYILAILLAPTVSVITLSELASEKTKESMKTNDTIRTICFIIIIGFIFKLLELIPTFGGIISALAILVGFGIIIKSFIPDRENKKDETEVVTKQ